MFFTDNDITGELPSQWSEIGPLLTAISVGKNLLNGELPLEWESLSGLRKIRLNDNPELGGSIPDNWLSSMKSIHTIDIQKTNVTTEASWRERVLKDDGVTVIVSQV